MDRIVQALRERHAKILREPAQMPWGEHVADIADPEGNLVSIAAARD